MTTESMFRLAFIVLLAALFAMRFYFMIKVRRSGGRIRWDARNPQELETWGLHLLDHWYYFDNPEPRLRLFRWMRFIPLMAKATGIFLYRLGT